MGPDSGPWFLTMGKTTIVFSATDDENKMKIDEWADGELFKSQFVSTGTARVTWETLTEKGFDVANEIEMAF